MFIPYTADSVRYTGRFSPVWDAMVAAATGSYFEIGFTGDLCTLHFDIYSNYPPYPHMWIQVDGGAKVEVPLAPFLKIQAGEGTHVAKVTLKGVRETHSRWHHPIAGQISFKGYEAEGPAPLPEDNRKTIEFVGDSITEGVLTDAACRLDTADDQSNRGYQDDATATYAALAAEALNLRPLTMGYGAVGVTDYGHGGVPKAAEAYPYCFEGAPVLYDHPDYILINHGANDRGAGEDRYIEEYRGLLDVIRKLHPHSQIISMSAFCGSYPEALGKLIAAYNEEHGDNILFIDATLWIPLNPLHPQRDGHKIIANKLAAVLKKEFGL